MGPFVNRLEEGIISLLLVSMTLIVFVEVVLRYVFSVGFPQAEELTLHMSGWMVLFGASYGVKVGSHIGVNIAVEALPSRPRRVVALIAVALCLVYCVLLGMGAWTYLAKVYSIRIELQDLPIPKYVAHSILLLGFILLAVRFLDLGYRIIQGKSQGFGHADEAKEALRQLELEESQSTTAAGRGA